MNPDLDERLTLAAACEPWRVGDSTTCEHHWHRHFDEVQVCCRCAARLARGGPNRKDEE